MSGLPLDTPVGQQDADEKVSRTAQIEMRGFQRAKRHCARALHAILRSVAEDDDPTELQHELRDLCLDWLVNGDPED